jgi:excisionase family DNA binding protein
MSSLVTQMIVAERFGLRLKVEQLANVLGLSKGTIYNQISAGTLPVPTYVDGGTRWADYRDVAEHLDKCRESARHAA